MTRRRSPLAIRAVGGVRSLDAIAGPVRRADTIATRRGPAPRRRWACRALLGLALLFGWPALGLAQTTTLVEYYHTDVLGSVRVVTNAQGQVLARHDFTPFGEELHPPSPPMDRKLFTGQEHDLETGQDYFHARQMMAEIARFGAFDPLSTTPSARGNAQDFNGYAYARNNPLRFKDPTGLAYWEVPLFDFPWAFLPRGGTFGTHTTASSPASAYLSDNPPSDWSADWLAAIGGGGPQVDPNRPGVDQITQLAREVARRVGALGRPEDLLAGAFGFHPEDPRPSCFGEFLTGTVFNMTPIPGASSFAAPTTDAYQAAGYQKAITHAAQRQLTHPFQYSTPFKNLWAAAAKRANLLLPAAIVAGEAQTFPAWFSRVMSGGCQ